MARRRKNEKRQKSIRYFDYSLLFLIIFLLCFGLIMLYSTSSYYGSTRFNDAAYYVKSIATIPSALAYICLFT